MQSYKNYKDLTINERINLKSNQQIYSGLYGRLKNKNMLLTFKFFKFDFSYFSVPYNCISYRNQLVRIYDNLNGWLNDKPEYYTGM